MSLISSDQIFMDFSTRGEEERRLNVLMFFLMNRIMNVWTPTVSQTTNIESHLCLYKASWFWQTGWISGWWRTAADVFVIRMIQPHSLYKRISPQVTDHLYEKDMGHRDQMVRSGSVTTHVTIQAGVWISWSSVYCTECGVVEKLTDWEYVLYLSVP